MRSMANDDEVREFRKAAVLAAIAGAASDHPCRDYEAANLAKWANAAEQWLSGAQARKDESVFPLLETVQQLIRALEAEDCAPERIDIVMPAGHTGDVKIRDLLLGGKLAPATEWSMPTRSTHEDDAGWFGFQFGPTRVVLRRVGKP